MEKIISATWYPAKRLVETRLSGLLAAEDILTWQHALKQAMDSVPDHAQFRMLVNLHGFKAADFTVHQQYRTIMPLLLADYGYRIGYLDMFPEAKLELKNTRGIRCVAMANVHQDESKMNDYNARFASAHERYFTDAGAAQQWIESL